MADAEPQARATPFRSGAEKGIEDLAKVFGQNPRTIVSKRDPDMTLHVVSFDPEFPSLMCLSHGLLSIQNDIQENLLNLTEINDYLGKARSKVCYDFNIAGS